MPLVYTPLAETLFSKDDKNRKQQQQHFIFCVDVSGSMDPQKFAMKENDLVLLPSTDCSESTRINKIIQYEQHYYSNKPEYIQKNIFFEEIVGKTKQEIHMRRRPIYYLKIQII